jgi:hypothetical protein
MSLRLCVLVALLLFGSPAFSGTSAPVVTETPWIVLIEDGGVHGFEKLGKSMVICGDVKADPKSKDLSSEDGQGVIAVLSRNPAGGRSNLVTRDVFGDCEVELEFAIGRQSNSGVKLQERYEIQLYDSHAVEKPNAKHSGGVYPHWKFGKKGQGLDYIDEGVPPRRNAARPAGQWQTLRIVFTAPRFDEQGQKTSNAKFESVVLNGETVQENVELDSPTGNASTPMKETAMAPLMLQMDHGPVAFRNVRVRSR